MSAKEPTVERRHELLAEEAVDAGCVGYFTEIRAGMIDQLRRSVAQAIANAEAAASAKAVETFVALFRARALLHLSDDGFFFEVFKNVTVKSYPTIQQAATAACEKFCLLPPKGDDNGR